MPVTLRPQDQPLTRTTAARPEGLSLGRRTHRTTLGHGINWRATAILGQDVLNSIDERRLRRVDDSSCRLTTLSAAPVYRDGPVRNALPRVLRQERRQPRHASFVRRAWLRVSLLRRELEDSRVWIPEGHWNLLTGRVTKRPATAEHSPHQQRSVPPTVAHRVSLDTPARRTSPS